MSDQPAPPQQRKRDTQHGRLIFFVSLVLITFVRFYLLRGEDIVTNNSGYDDYLFVELGEHAFWWRPPDEASLVRLPVYPLWIWLCHQTGVPLYLGTNMLAIAASFFLVYALRKLNLPRFACAVVYAAQLFEFNAIDSMRRAVASNVYGILFVATLAWMGLALASRRRLQLWIVSVGLAISLGLFAITRAESILAWIAFIFFVVAFILREFMAADRKRVSLQIIVAAGLLPALALIAAPLALAMANKKVFGVFTSCSLTSRASCAAINHLLAIQPDKDIPYVPVTRDARKKAYAVSPAFEKLAPFLEGTSGRRWGERAFVAYHISPEEIGGGWFFFALRRAIASAGAQTPAQSEAYFWRIAMELHQAFKDGKLPKRRVWLSLVQPDSTIWRRISPSFNRIFARTLNPYPPVNILEVVRPPNSIPTIEETFDRVTYRRSFDAVESTTISGWGFSNGEPVTSILVSKGDGTPLPVTFKSFERPAVFEANKKQFPSMRRHAPFGFTLTVPVGNRQRIGGTMRFIFGDGTELPLQLTSLQVKKFALGGNATQQRGWVRVEAVTDADGSRRDLRLATQQMSAAAKFYSLVFKILLVAVVPAVILLLVMRASATRNLGLYLWLIPLTGFLAARLAILAIIDASSFNGTGAGYLAIVAGPLAAAAIVLIAQAMVGIRSHFSRSEPSEADHVEPEIASTA